MNKKLITIGITLLIVGMIIAPVSAIVTPPTTFKDAFFKGLWTAVLDLQNQITALTTKVNTIPAGQACWDLNNNHVCDVALEDKTGDGQCTVADCKGPKGDTGATGANGKDGAPGADGAPVHFGSWDNSIHGGIDYVAATDGFVIMSMSCVVQPIYDECQLYGLTESHPIVLGVDEQKVLGYPNNHFINSMTMPVRKGDHWMLNWVYGQEVYIYWIPLST